MQDRNIMQMFFDIGIDIDLMKKLIVWIEFNILHMKHTEIL